MTAYDMLTARELHTLYWRALRKFVPMPPPLVRAAEARFGEGYVHGRYVARAACAYELYVAVHCRRSGDRKYAWHMLESAKEHRKHMKNLP